ncbi:MAG: patatin-like phospholipase family protein [Pseudomonadota bacterium]
MTIFSRLVIAFFAAIGVLTTVGVAAVVFFSPATLPAPSPPVEHPSGAYPLHGRDPAFPADFGQVEEERPAGDPIRILALSSGGEGGAYGAGILAASSTANDWPDFDIYTGVSVGSLLAATLYAGQSGEDDFKAIVEDVAAAVEAGRNANHRWDVATVIFGKGTVVSRAVQRVIRDHFNEDMVQRMAEQHRKGKRLYAISTDLTVGTPLLWDLGAIAAGPGPDNVADVQKALLAGTSVPLIFPAQVLEASGDYTLQVDGAIMRPFFISDNFIKLGAERPLEVHFLVNDKLDATFTARPLSPRVDSIAHRLLSVMYLAETRGFLDRLLLDSLLFGWTVNVASIPDTQPDTQKADEMTEASIMSAFNSAYETTETVLDAGGDLAEVWVPLTADLIGLKLPCHVSSSQCADEPANAAVSTK